MKKVNGGGNYFYADILYIKNIIYNKQRKQTPYTSRYVKDICIINEHYIMHVYIYLNMSILYIRKGNPLYKYIKSPTYNGVVMIFEVIWKRKTITYIYILND